MQVHTHDQKVTIDGAYSTSKTHGSESRSQGGSSKQRPDGLETHTREY